MDILVLKDTLKKLTELDKITRDYFHFDADKTGYCIDSFIIVGGMKYQLLKKKDNIITDKVAYSIIFDLTFCYDDSDEILYDTSHTYTRIFPNTISYFHYQSKNNNEISCYVGLDDRAVVLNYPVQEDEYFQKSTMMHLLELESINGYMRIFQEICTEDIERASISRNNYSLTSEEISDMFEEFISFVHSSSQS